MKLLQRLFFTALLSLTASTGLAQYYSGEHTFDGENRNEASASVTTGKNILVGPCIGNTVHYKR